jgi:FkbM family methyltransferase
MSGAGLARQAVEAVRRRGKLEFRRQLPRDWIPSASLNLIDVLLPWYGRHRPEASLVQIGAYDGEAPAAVWRWAQQPARKVVCVEPVGRAFSKLQARYEGVANVMLVNAAIAREDGMVTMYVATDVTEGSDIRGQWSSFSRQHLVKLGVKDEEISAERVPCLTIGSLLKRGGIERPEVLVVDAEGFDGEIIDMALGHGDGPDLIYFEYCNLPGRDGTARVFDLLAGRGYRWVHDKRNTLALKDHLLPALMDA